MADEAAEKGYAGVVAAKSGLPCLGCGRTTSSSWRGPGLRYCAKHKCRNKAKEARGAGSEDAKDKRIEELEERLDEQAEEMAALREGLRAAQHAIKMIVKPVDGAPAQSKAPSAGARRPLASCNGNAAAQAAPQAPPTKKPKATLSAGWSTRPSQSRAGELTYINKEYGLVLRYAPDLQVAGVLCYEPQVDILAELDHHFLSADEGTLTKAEMQSLYEKCMALPKGKVEASERLRAAFSAAWGTLEQLRAEDEADEAEQHVLEYFEHATCGEAGLALTDETMLAALAKRGIGEACLERVVARLAAGGYVYSTIDDQHYAVLRRDE